MSLDEYIGIIFSDPAFHIESYAKQKYKEELMENIKKLRDDWKDLRSQIGNFVCKMDNALDVIENHADKFISLDEHAKECDRIYDASVEWGKDIIKEAYERAINNLYGLDIDVMRDLFDYDDMDDVLRYFRIESISERLDKYFEQQEQIQKEAARDAADHEINEWFRKRSNEIVEEYTKRKRDIGVQVDRITFDRKEHHMEGQE